MKSRLIAIVSLLFFLLTPLTASAAELQYAAASQAIAPIMVSSSQTMHPQLIRYHSGFRSGSSRLGGSFFGRSRSSFGSRSSYGYRSGFGSHMFSFGTGWMMGSLFHPFGGYYGYGSGYGYHHFSLLGLILDLLVLYFLWRIVRWFFSRR